MWWCLQTLEKYMGLMKHLHKHQDCLQRMKVRLQYLD